VSSSRDRRNFSKNAKKVQLYFILSIVGEPENNSKVKLWKKITQTARYLKKKNIDIHTCIIQKA
jgi:hypothetical protein